MPTLTPPFAASGAPSALLEREREVSAIDAALTRVQDGAGTAVVIVGEPGIGKSTLVRHAVEAATQRGLRVLRAQGGELERELPYGTVVELFGTIAREEPLDGDLFAGPARAAAPLFGLGRSPGHGGLGLAGERADPVAYLHGLYWLVANLAQATPLGIVVDDAQWADEASLRFLHHVVKRASDLPLLVVLAMRPEAGSPASAAGALLRAHSEAVQLRPDALSEGAVGTLVEDLLGRPVSSELRHAAWKATGGNAFFVTELAADLGRGATRSLAADVETLLPERVERSVAGSLAGADPSARSLAEAVAVLGESATLHRAARLAILEPRAAEAAVRWLIGAFILRDASALGFRHPIVRSAIDAAIPLPARAELHRRAALILAADDAAIGVIGAQLRAAAAAADPRVVDLLLAAAEDAAGRGEPQTAVALLRRALAEPPANGARAVVLAELARAEAAVGLPAAVATFGEALALVHDPDPRASLHLDLGHALVGSGQWAAARDVFAQGLEEAAGAEEALRTRLEAGYLSSAWVTMADRSAIGDRVREILDADLLGEANRELAAWIAFQQGAVVGSSASEMGALIRKVLAEAPAEELVSQGQVIEVAAGVLLETDDLPFEVDVLTRAIDAARATGPIGKAGVYAYCRAWPYYYMGRLTDAIADGEESLRAAELGWETFVPAGVTVTALAHIERDDLDAAGRVLAIDPEAWAGRIDTAMLLPLAMGRLALARGDVDGAAEELRRAAEGAATAFMRNSVPTDWRTWYATALLRLDRRDEARTIAQEGVEIARAWGARWPLGAALRGLGLVEGGAAGIALLREGEELLADGPARLEHARLLVTLGATLRRHGSLTEAREVLGRAADLSHRLGAWALLRRATSELRAAGARPRRVALTGIEALTPAERRVVQEALGGRTNREIAQALFVTPKAVEYHLANAYRKLGISSRAELAAAMGRWPNATER